MGATPIYHDTPTPDFDAAAGYPPAAIKTELGRRLYARMLERGWNQSELARSAGLGRDSISVYIRGKSMPGPGHLDALCKALEITPDDLMPGIHAATANRHGGSTGDSVPLEIRQVGAGKVWLKLNRAVSLDQAAKILAILDPDSRENEPPIANEPGTAADAKAKFCMEGPGVSVQLGGGKKRRAA